MNIHSLCLLALSPEKSATVVSHPPPPIRCSHRMEAKGWSDERGGRRLSPGVLMSCSPLAAHELLAHRELPHRVIGRRQPSVPGSAWLEVKAESTDGC